ncbi:hypothetical protein ABK040_002541 [Willaertia magna]
MVNFTEIDLNIICFEIFQYLDDQSLINLSSSCKQFKKLILENDLIWKIKLQNYITHQFLKDEFKIINNSDNNEINNRIKDFVNNYFNNMFNNLQNLKQIEGLDPIILENSNYLNKLKYILLKYKFIFKQHKKLNEIYNNCHTFYNNQTNEVAHFIKMYYSTLILQPKHTYYCRFLVNFKKDQLNYTDDIQIKIESPKSSHSTTTFYSAPKKQFGFRYSICFNSLVKHGNNSYLNSNNNFTRDGDCIGMKIDWTDVTTIYLNFYFKIQNVVGTCFTKQYEKRIKEYYISNFKKRDLKYRIAVGFKGENMKLITLLLWDGDIKNL